MIGFVNFVVANLIFPKLVTVQVNCSIFDPLFFFIFSRLSICFFILFVAVFCIFIHVKLLGTFFSLFLSFAVKFNGIFIPFPDIVLPTTDCPPAPTPPEDPPEAPPEAPPSCCAAQKTSKAKQSSASSQKNGNDKDVEVFRTTSKTTSTNAAVSVSKGQLESLDGDKQPKIKIEIHNVLSFADTKKKNENGANIN